MLANLQPLLPNFYRSVVLILTLFFLVMMPLETRAASEPVIIQMLSREECSHCQAAMVYFEALKTERKDFTFEKLDLEETRAEELFVRLTETRNLPKVTPYILVGDQLLQGFASAKTTGKIVEQLLDEFQDQPPTVQGFEAYLAQPATSKVTDKASTCEENEDCFAQEAVQTEYTLPVLGTINVARLSLPSMSLVLGFIDGFNPCAMWVLITFLLILAQLKSRRKMFWYAGLFILAEAIMYTLILTLWYTAWDFVGLDRIVTPLVGLVAIGGGVFFLYEFKTSKAGECKVTNLRQRQSIRNRIQSVISKPLTLTTALGVIMIAFSVNIIEFACSIGIPQTFTKILELNNLSLMQTSLMMGLYILMYMVDDFIVFGVALYSFEKIGLTHKYSKLTNLIGGILMIVLGAILLFKPELLQMI